MTAADLAACRKVYEERERRLEDRAHRAALFTAVKVFDSENKVDRDDYFPSLDPANWMTQEEYDRMIWNKAKAVFASIARKPDGSPKYAIDRSNPG